VLPQFTGQDADQRGQYGPVRPGQARLADLATQNGKLTPQHEQLG
jgi:hypothetical protein